MRTLILATRNAHKAQEIRDILGGQFSYASLNDLPGCPSTEEDRETFAGNAEKKAEELGKWVRNRPIQKFGRFAILADDSGLEVRTLGWAPGIYSARFAGLDEGRAGNSTDKANNEKLLRLMSTVPPGQRQARFRCVLALWIPRDNASASPGRVKTFEGICSGRIAFEPEGQSGFGYDPLFIPEGYDQAFAELDPGTKNKISHRASALKLLKAWFVSNSQEW